jgi:hypothetical protein
LRGRHFGSGSSRSGLSASGRARDAIPEDPAATEIIETLRVGGADTARQPSRAPGVAW